MEGQDMTDYTELVKALRCKRDDCEGCELAFFDKDEGWMCRYAAKDDDAADEIEALQAELEKKRTADCWGCKCEKLEPNRGEWIDLYDEDDKPFFKRKYLCSACGHWNTYGKSKYCPNCGAKMEVQE